MSDIISLHLYFFSEVVLQEMFGNVVVHCYLCRNFKGNNLACDCNVYSSLVAVIKALSADRAAVCVSPPRVASVEFYPQGSYENQPVQDFTCCMYSAHVFIKCQKKILSEFVDIKNCFAGISRNEETCDLAA